MAAPAKIIERSRIHPRLQMLKASARTSTGLQRLSLEINRLRQSECIKTGYFSAESLPCRFFRIFGVAAYQPGHALAQAASSKIGKECPVHSGHGSRAG